LLEIRGWVSLSADLRGNGGRPPTTFGVRKLVPRLSCGIVCVILLLIQYRRVTETRTQTMMGHACASLAPRGYILGHAWLSFSSVELSRIGRSEPSFNSVLLNLLS